MRKIFIIVTTLILYSSNSLLAQTESVYSVFKEYTVAIGYTDSVMTIKNSKIKEKKFILVGSGLVTYCRQNSKIIPTIVTAKHVIKFFTDNNIDTFRIRFSWADSINTNNYFGIANPALVDKKLLTYFFHSNQEIDLGCIILSAKADTIEDSYYKSKPIHTLAYNDIKNPNIGDNVLILGYPGHIESFFSNLSYNVCTFKPGIVTWVATSKTKTYLDNLILVESNASYGNSGGPVFSLNIGSPKEASLIGILTGGMQDTNQVQLNGKNLIDSTTKAPYLVGTRSGVSIVLKAELVRELLDDVTQKISSPFIK